MPEFSVVMPCYNAADTLNDSIQSVLGQTLGSWELICVDDGSTDDTPRLLALAARSDPRITVLQNTGKGPSVARNLGAEQARGQILCFLDADDLWQDTRLDHLHRAFLNPRTDGAFGQVAFFRTPGQADTMSTPPDGPLSIPVLLGENPVCTMSNVAVRRKIFLQSGGLNPELVHNEDLEWLIRVTGLAASIVPLQGLHVWYRTSLQGLSSDLPEMARSRQDVLQTARRFGFAPDARAEAVYARYLARRALRLGLPGQVALRLMLSGLRHHPAAFLLPLRRGLLTALGALIAPALPHALRRSLFSR